MKRPQDPMEARHQERREWLSLLDFYKEEIQIFERELQEVVQQHPGSLSMVEHTEEYEQILFRKRQKVEAFRAQVATLEQKTPFNKAPEAAMLANQQQLGVAIHAFSAELEAMKQNFRRFVSHND